MRAVAFAAVLLAAAAPSRAAVSITAALSHSEVSLDEQLVLSVTVSGDRASLPQPKLPPLDGFSVYDSGRNQSLSFVNGRMTSSVIYTFVLVPRAAGKFRIPPIAADGAPAPTDEMIVEVSPAGGAPAAPRGTASDSRSGRGGPAPAAAPARRRAREVFVVATLDKARAFVNEQVTLSVRFYSAVQLVGDLRYDAPSMTGFLTEDLPPVRNGTASVDGRAYQYSEIKVAVFPVQPGRLTIGPATVRCQIARMAAPGVDDFFDRFFSMGTPQPVAVDSPPLTLQVDPLPEGKPADFSGVVGSLSARVAADRTEIKAGDAVTLTVTVAGRGNLKTIPEPQKPDLPALRFFTTESSMSLDKAEDRVGGAKIFRTVVVPRVSGEVRVPGFSFPYYDAQRRRYARAETDGILLRVAPGEGKGAAAAPSAPTAPELTVIADDIRYLKISPTHAFPSAALAAVADLGALHFLPFAALAFASILAWRRRRAASDPSGNRFREALSRAEARLAQASDLAGGDAARAVALIDDTLADFVADKLDAPAAGLTLKSALDGLKALPQPPSAETIERLRAVWEEADLRRFAPGAVGGDARSFAEAARAVLAALDAEVRR